MGYFILLFIKLFFICWHVGLYGATEPLIADQQNLVDENSVDQALTQEPEAATEPTTETPQAPLRFPIPIPHIGTFILEGTVDVEKQTFSLSGRPEKERYEIGPLAIEKPKLTLSLAYGLQLDAIFSIFNQRLAKAGIEKFNPLTKELVLSIGLPEPYKLPITPWKSIQIQSIYLALSSTEKKVFTNLFLSPDQKDKITITFGSEKQTSIAGAQKKDLILNQVQDDKIKGNFAEISVVKLKLSAFLDELKKTPLDKMVIESGTVRISQPLTKNVDHIVTFEGIADFSQLNTNLSADQVSKLTFDGVLDKKRGSSFSFNVSGEVPLIPSILTLKNAYFNLTSIPPGAILPPPTTQGAAQTSLQNQAKGSIAQVQQTSFSFAGDASVLFPNPVGAITTHLTATFKNGRFESFEGVLGKPINFFDIVKITETSVRFSRTIDPLKKYEKDLLEVVGKSTILDELDIQAHLQAFKETTGPQKGQYVFQFLGKAAQGKVVKPFAQIPGIQDIPLASDLAISNIECSLDTKKNFKIAGTTIISGFPAQATILKTQTATVVKAAPSKGWKLTDSVSALRGTPFEKINFSNINLTFASADYLDPDTKLTFPAGFAFVAGMDLSAGMFVNAKKILPSTPDLVFAACTFDKMSAGLTIAIPTIVNIGGATLENIFVLARYKLPAELILGIKTKIRTRLPMQKEDTLFVGEFDLSTDPKSSGVIIKGSMVGEWREPLGVPGIAVSDVAFELGAGLMAVPPFITPKSLGYTGKIEVGSKRFMVATKIADNGDIVMQGSLEGTLSVEDLTSIPRKLGIAIPNLSFFDDINIQDVVMKLASKDTTIGEIPFYQGITLKGKLNILGAYALVDVTVEKTGVRALGAVSPMKLGGFLKLSRAEFAQGMKLKVDHTKYGSLDGPVIELTVTPQKQEFYLSGLIELLGAQSQTEAYIGKQGIKFTTDTNLVFAKIKLTGVSSGSGKNIDFDVHGEFENDFYEYVNDQVRKGIAIFEQETRKGINQAQQEIDKINTQIDALDQQIDDRNKKIKRLKDTIDRKTREAKEKVAGARQKVKDAQDKVNSLDKQIRSRKKELGLAHNEYQSTLLAWNPFSKSSWEDAGNAIADTGKKAGNAIADTAKKAADAVADAANKAKALAELAALEAARGVAWAALQAAREFLKGVEVVAFDPTSLQEAGEITKIGIEVAGLETGKVTLIASRETAKGTLEGIKQTAVGLGKAAQFLIEHTGKLFYVKKATLDFSVNDMFTKGIFPRITMDVNIAGQDIKGLVFQLDVKHPEKLIEAILKNIGKFFGV